jgi:hypothetical protein
MTDEAFLSLLRQGWLVLAVVVFFALLWRTLRPTAGKSMRDHALIPFQIKDDDHGAA